jgi:amidohydrolase
MSERMHPDVSALKRRACDEIDRLRDMLVDVSLAIHANPELSFEEVQASRRLCDELAMLGFTVERGVGSLPTAFRAEAPGHGDGGVVAFLAEYDAIRHYGHSCGHNIVAAAALGAGAGIMPVMQDLPGAALVLGTPAEEGGGKNIMAREGIFDGIDAAMLIYPGMDNIAASRTLAVTGFKVEMFGKAAHAAARPELGINALDALLLGLNGVAALRQQIRSDARIHAIITDGGRLPMVIPDYTKAEVRVRANDTAYLEELTPRVVACFEGAARMTGAHFEHSWRPDSRRGRALRPNTPFAACFAANLRSLGREVRDTDEIAGAWSGDTGNVSHLVPIIQPQIAMTGRDVPPHSHEFAAASATPTAAVCIVDAAKAMAMSAIDVLSDPVLRAIIRRDFVRAAG